MALTHIGEAFGLRDACDHADAELARCESNKGIGMWCGRCRNWVTKQVGYDRPWLPKDHPALAGLDLTRLETIGQSIYRKCAGPCGALAFCELHHVAPKSAAFFGADEADRWPLIWLCRPCHQRWHTVVTPGLCTSYDAADHARRLFTYLGKERMRALYAAIRAEGEARKTGEAA